METTLEFIQSNVQVQPPSPQDLLFLSGFKCWNLSGFGWSTVSFLPHTPRHFIELNYKPDPQSTCICHPSPIYSNSFNSKIKGETQEGKWYIQVPKVCGWPFWVSPDLLDLGSMLHWGLCITHGSKVLHIVSRNQCLNIDSS